MIFNLVIVITFEKCRSKGVMHSWFQHLIFGDPQNRIKSNLVTHMVLRYVLWSPKQVLMIRTWVESVTPVKILDFGHTQNLRTATNFIK